MGLKIGNKVRNTHNNLEGKVVYSTSGASVSGFTYDDNGNKVHFQTLGQPLHELEKEWVRIYKYKYKYNMKGNN